MDIGSRVEVVAYGVYGEIVDTKGEKFVVDLDEELKINGISTDLIIADEDELIEEKTSLCIELTLDTAAGGALLAFRNMWDELYGDEKTALYHLLAVVRGPDVDDEDARDNVTRKLRTLIFNGSDVWSEKSPIEPKDIDDLEDILNDIANCADDVDVSGGSWNEEVHAAVGVLREAFIDSAS